MTRLVWDVIGERLFETGIDRGVLYVDDVGYPWSGIVSVDEAPSGGEARSYYLDGIKYLNLPDKEEFKATLQAYYSPKEFDACDGVGLIHSGLRATQQRRKSFGLTYRTRIGNDINSSSHGYKIHILYNALAAPSRRTYSTENATPQVALLGWDLTTKPVPIPDLAYSSHLVVDSTEAPTSSLAELEDILYGSDSTTPRLPTPDEVAALFMSEIPFVVTDLTGGLFEISGSDIAVADLGGGLFEISGDTVITIDESTSEISSE